VGKAIGAGTAGLAVSISVKAEGEGGAEEAGEEGTEEDGEEGEGNDDVNGNEVKEAEGKGKEDEDDDDEEEGEGLEEAAAREASEEEEFDLGALGSTRERKEGEGSTCLSARSGITSAVLASPCCSSLKCSGYRGKDLTNREP